MPETKKKLTWNDIVRLQPDADGDGWEDAQVAVEELFTYQKWTPEQEHAGNEVKDALVNAFSVIVAHVPAGPARTSALRKIYEARMDANSAITHKGNV